MSSYGSYQPFDYQLLANLGPNIINAQLSGQKMLDMEEERKMREQKRLVFEKDQAFKKGLAEYYTTESAKPSLLGPPPVGLGTTGGGGDIDSGMFDVQGQRRTPLQEPAPAMATIQYNQAKAAEKPSPNRLAADYALKSGNIDYYLHFEKMAQVEEDEKRKAASAAMHDVITVWDKFGKDGLQAAWPMLSAGHPEMLNGVDPKSLEFKTDAGVVEVTLSDGHTKVIFNKSNPKDMHIVPKQPTEEERKAALEKVKAETEAQKAHSGYYKAASAAAAAKADAYQKGLIGGAVAKPGKVTAQESMAVDDYVASQYFNHYGKSYNDKKWIAENPPTMAAKYGGRGGLFKKFIDDVYDPIRTGKGSTTYSGVQESRMGLYPSGTFIKNNFDWVNQRVQQLYSYKVPIPQAYAQATTELNQIMQAQLGDYSKVDWKTARIQLPALQSMNVPGVQIPAPQPGPAGPGDGENFPDQEFDYDPVTRTLKPRL